MKLFSPAALAAISSGQNITTGAVAILCDPAVRVWGGNGPWEIDGETFNGIGDRGLAQITGGAIGGSEQNITLTLSGIDPDVAALFDATELLNAPVLLYRMIFDGSGREQLDCRIWKRGRVDDAVRDEEIGALASIIVQVETAARGLGRSNQRMRSDADQRLVDPVDGFFKHTSYAASKQIYMGGKKSAASATTMGGGIAGGVTAPAV